MAETVASLASLLKLGASLPQQPPRFAKVTAISGDTVTVSLGSGTADAVRCCDCAVDDVVLLETLPSGILAAVGVKGYSGGSYTLPPATTTTLGGVIADGTSITVDLDGTIHAAGLTCTENSGGVQLSSYDLEKHAGSWPASGGWGWREEKWSDGRLTVYVWYWVATTSSGWNSIGGGFNYPTASTPFIDTPFPTATVFDSASSASGAAMVNITALHSALDTFGYKMTYYNSAANSNSKRLILLRMDGHWQ